MVKQFITSKKFVVFALTVIVSAAVMFGIPEESALTFVDKLVQLAMVYMGSQGVADVGKYAGEAIAEMRNKNLKPAEDGGTADG
jgi:hypothetical protein